MARREDGSLICPQVGPDDTLITERHHAAHLDVASIANAVMAGQREVPELVYGDMTTTAQSLQEALDRIEMAQDQFDAIPANVRLKADNSIVRFAEMLETEESTQVLVDAGLELQGFEPSEPVVVAEGSPTEPVGDPVEAAVEAPSE